MKRFVITPEHANSRLDLFLTEKMGECSRSQIQKMIKEGAVTVDGKTVAPHRFLKEGDRVVIPALSSVIPAKAGIQTIPTEGRNSAVRISAPRMIAETPDYLIIEKPVGLVVHPGVKRERDTLVDWLLAHYPEIKKIGDDPLRPGIVHRLDKDASGVMVVARTQDSFESLIRQFKLRQVKKEYMALVSGRVTPTDGVIDLPIGRSAKDYTKRAAHAKEGRSAITKYEVVDQYKHTALVHVMPETGRTHQIRVHFFAKGNPIVGDSIYKQKKTKPAVAERLMLHAVLLGFRDLSGEWQEYRVEPSEEFETLVQRARTA